MKKYMVLALLAILTVAGMYAYRMYNKPHAEMAAMPTAYTLKASELFEQYSGNESEADTRYLNQVLEVTGTIEELSLQTEKPSLMLATGADMGYVIGELDMFSDHATEALKVGQTVTIKGICTGFLMDVVLVRCLIISNQ